MDGSVTTKANRRRRRDDGERTHAAILQAATKLASVEGLHGLTIGRLAESLGVSKSGLYAHFDSKEHLQLETIEAAQRIYEREVSAHALEAPAGLARLKALCEAYFSYVGRRVFPGGCFFASLLAEMDARSGPMHDVAQSLARAGQESMVELVHDAQRLGELDGKVDAQQLAFELQGCLDWTNYQFVLFDDPEILKRGRRAVESVLERARPQKRRPAGRAESTE